MFAAIVVDPPGHGIRIVIHGLPCTRGVHVFDEPCQGGPVSVTALFPAAGVFAASRVLQVDGCRAIGLLEIVHRLGSRVLDFEGGVAQAGKQAKQRGQSNSVHVNVPLSTNRGQIQFSYCAAKTGMSRQLLSFTLQM